MASRRFTNWAKNFGKSTKYAAANIASDIMPNTIDGITNTRQAAADLRSSIRNGKSSMDQFVRETGRGKLAQRAKKEYKAGISAVKTGNFAIKNSMRKKPSGSKIGSIPGLDDFDSMLGDFDDSFFTNDSGEAVFSPRINVNMDNATMLEAMRVSNEIQAQTSLHSANVISDSVNNTMISGFIKMNQEVINTNRYLANIDSNIQAMIEFNNDNVASVNMATMDFMTEAKEYVSVMKDYVQELKTAKDEAAKSREAVDLYDKREKLGQGFLTGSFNPIQYKEFVSNNIKSAVSPFIEMAKMFMPDVGGIVSGEKNLIEVAFTSALKSLLFPPGFKDVLGRLDKLFPNIIRDFLVDIGDKGGILSNILGIRTNKLKNVELGEYYKGEMSWDGEAKQVLVKTIPGQLNQIIRLLTPEGDRDKSDMNWNSYTGRYESTEQIFKNLEKRVKEDYAMQMSSYAETMSQVANRTLAEMFSDEDMRKEAYKQFKNLDARRISHNALIKAGDRGNKIKTEDIDTITELAKKNGISEDIIPALIEIYKRTPNEARVEERDRTIEVIENNNELLQNIARGVGDADVFQNLERQGINVKDLIKYAIEEANVYDLNRFDTRDRYEREAEKLGIGSDSLVLDGFRFIGSEYENYKQQRDNALRTNAYADSKNPLHRFLGGLVPGLLGIEKGVTEFAYGDKAKAVTGMLEQFVNWRSDRKAKNVSPEEFVGPMPFIGPMPIANPGAMSPGAHNANVIRNAKIEAARQQNGGIIRGIDGDDEMYDFIKHTNQAIIPQSAIDEAERAVHGLNDEGEGSEEDPENTREAVIQGYKAQKKSFTGLVYGLYSTFLKPSYDKVFGKDGIISKFMNDDRVKHVTETVKKTLIGEKGDDRIYRDGLFSSFANMFGDGVDYLKYTFTGQGYTSRDGTSYPDKVEESVFGKIKSGFKTGYEYMMQYLFGKDGDYRENPLFQQTFGKLETSFAELHDKIKKYDAVTAKRGTIDIEAESTETEEVKEESGTDTEDRKDDKDSKKLEENALVIATKKFTEEMDTRAKNVGERFEEFMYGSSDESDDSKKRTIMQMMKDALPKVALGATIGAAVPLLAGGNMGLLLGTLLPGNPIGGAIVGMGAGLLANSEKFKTLLFGEKGEDGRVGGLISKNLQEKFKGMLPIFIGGGMLGALKTAVFGSSPLLGVGILGQSLLPGGVIGGALLSVGGALLYRSEKFQELMFGKKDEEGNRQGTAFSEALSKASETLKKNANFVAGGLKGALLGGVSSAVIGNMGVLGGALTVGGPIGGALVGLGLGIASQTDRFKRLLFGDEKEYDEDGNVISRENNGLISRFLNKMEVDVFSPASQAMQNVMTNMSYWVRLEVVSPFKRMVGPVIDSFTNLKDDIRGAINTAFVSISNGVTEFLAKAFEPVTNAATKIAQKLSSTAFNFMKITGKIAGGLLTAPLKMGAGLSQAIFGRKEEKAFRKEYRQNRASAMDNALTNGASMLDLFFGSKGEDGRRDSSTAFFGKDSNYYLEQRKQYGDEHGLNSLDWWMEPTKRREIKEQWKEEKQRQRKEKELLNIRSRWQKEDKHVENEQLKEARYMQRRKELEEAGFDVSNINSVQDLNSWTYRNREFNEKIEANELAQGLNQELLDINSDGNDIARQQLDIQQQQLKAINTLTHAILDPASVKGKVRGIDGDSYDNNAELIGGEVAEVFTKMKAEEKAAQDAENLRKEAESLNYENLQAKEADEVIKSVESGKAVKTSKKSGLFTLLAGGMGLLGNLISGLGGIKGILVDAGAAYLLTQTEFGQKIIDGVGSVVKSAVSALWDKVRGVDNRTNSDNEYIEPTSISDGTAVSATLKAIGRNKLGDSLRGAANIARTALKSGDAILTHTPIVKHGVNMIKGIGNAINSGLKHSKYFTGDTGATLIQSSKNIISNFISKAATIMREALEGPKLAKLLGSNSKVLKGIGTFIETAMKMLLGAGDGAVRIFADVISQKGSKIIGGALEAVPVLGTALMIGTGIWDLATGAMDAANLFGVRADEVDGRMRVVSSVMKFLIGLSLPGVILDVIITAVGRCFNVDWKRALATEIYRLISDDEGYEKLKVDQNEMIADWEIEHAKSGISQDAYIDSQSKVKSKPKVVTAFRNQTSIGSTTSNAQALNLQQQQLVTNAALGAIAKIGKGDGTAVGFGDGLSQRDPRWKDTIIGRNEDGSVATMGSGGCGPTALAMAYQLSTGESISPSDVGRFAANSGYISKGGANADLFTKGANDLGLPSKRLSANQIESHLSGGNPVIVSGKSNSGNSLYSKVGHIMTIKGVDDTGNVTVLDPLDGKTKKHPLKALLRGLTNAWGIGNGKAQGDPGDVTGYTYKKKYESDFENLMFDSKTLTLDGQVWQGYNGVPYYNQANAKWGKNRYGNSTIGKQGCVMTSLAMALSGMTGKALTPDVVVDRWGNKYYVSGRGTDWEIMNTVANKYNMRSTRIEDSATLKAAIEANKPVVLFGSKTGGVYGSGGTVDDNHSVLATGVTPSKNVRINDPGSLVATKKYISEGGVSFNKINKGFKFGYAFEHNDGSGLSYTDNYELDTSLLGNIGNSLSSAGDIIGGIIGKLTEQVKPFTSILGNWMYSILSGEDYESVYDESGNFIGSNLFDSLVSGASEVYGNLTDGSAPANADTMLKNANFYNAGSKSNGKWTGFGNLSALFESGDNYAAYNPDPPNWAFGRYQFNSKFGLVSLMDMMKSKYPEFYRKYFSQTSIGNPRNVNESFKRAWVNAYASEPNKFKEIQDTAAYSLYYSNLIPGIEKHFGQSINKLQYAYPVKEAILSTNVQHGSGDGPKIIKSVPSLTPESEFIDKLYDARAKAYPSGKSRYKNEKATALELIENTKPVGFGDGKYKSTKVDKELEDLFNIFTVQDVQNKSNKPMIGKGNNYIAPTMKGTEDFMESLISGGRDDYDKFEFDTVGFGDLFKSNEGLIKQIPIGELITATKGSSKGVEEKLERLINVVDKKEMSNTINIDKRSNINMIGKGESPKPQKPVVINKSNTPTESRLQKKFEAMTRKK